MLEELILLLIVLFLEVKTYVITDIFIDIVVYSNYYNYYYYFTISIIYNVKILIDYTTKIRNYIMIINIIFLLILKIFFSFSNAVIERKFLFLSQDSYDFFNDVFIR